MKYYSALLLLATLSATQAWELPEFMKEYAAKEADTKHEPQIITYRAPVMEKVPLNDRGLNAFTAVPTESPAPSPSPSWAPTGAPTKSKAPTGKPTPVPTESPAPSPSPSWAPTFGPTDRPSSSPSQAPSPSPSLAPSAMPSKTPYPTISPSQIPTQIPSQHPSLSPSQVPSISQVPTSVPSLSPSDVPSQLPTTSEPSQAPSSSVQPSLSPSSMPSISPKPSSMPTHLTEMEASFVVTVGLKEKLNTTQVAAFERGTAKWLEETELETGTLSDVRVKVDDQTIIETDIPFQNRRSLQGRAPTLTRKDLQLSYTVFANYIGTDISFDLADTLDPEFQEKNTLWLREIDNEDPVFGQLNPIVSGIEEMEQQKQMQSKGGAGTMVIVLVVAVAAVALGVAASVYSVRSYRVSAYGQELASPHSQSLAAVSSDGLAVEVIPQPTKSFCLEPESTMHANQGITPGGQGGTGEYSSGVFNQNSMERGCNPMEPIIKNLSGNGRENKQYMMSGQQSLDPPSAASDVGIGSKRDGQANTNKAYTSRAPPPLDPVSVSDGGSRSNYRKNAIFDAAQTPSELSFSIAGNTHESGSHFRNTEPSRELQLTRTMGGTLGATAVNGSPQAPSDFSSQANSFFANFMGRNRKKRESSGTLGARRLGPNAGAKNRESNNSYDMLSRRAGLYDVFAPAGPIGIVVDTTKDGPVVHSLKSTSPMLGLMNPGDLIVGLDDVDTRSMTAATLTRLMAKKANQKERKITLLATDKY